MLGICLDQCPGNSKAQRTGLAGLPAAIHVRPNVERAEGIGRGKRLLDVLH
jgi:hypothetical protein